MHPLEIRCEDVKQKLDLQESFLLLDCREQEEYDLVHIAKSTLLPMSEIGDRLETLAPFREQEVIVYCHHGGRSLRVTNWLINQGFGNVKSMAGGIDVWAEKIDPEMQRY